MTSIHSPLQLNANQTYELVLDSGDTTPGYQPEQVDAEFINSTTTNKFTLVTFKAVGDYKMYYLVYSPSKKMFFNDSETGQHTVTIFTDEPVAKHVAKGGRRRSRRGSKRINRRRTRKTPRRGVWASSGKTRRR